MLLSFIGVIVVVVLFLHPLTVIPPPPPSPPPSVQVLKQNSAGKIVLNRPLKMLNPPNVM